MSLYRKRDKGARHLPGWQVALRTGVAGLAVATAQTAYANPTGGQVVAGQASINGQGTGRVRIDQSSDRVVINWDNFSIDLGQGVDFRQPNARSVALNRVTGPEISQILGELTANGQVYLINGNGIVFGKDARVDVAGLVATSADIGNEAFMAGGALRFGTPGRAGARIINHGSITVRDAGVAAFVAPQVANDGIITAHLGRIAFGGAQAFTLDLHGDNLIRFQVGDAVTKLDDKGALVGIDGVVDARGGSVLITASAARDLVNQSVRIGTPQAANMQVGADGKVSLVAAKVAITAPGEVQVGKNVAMDLSSATNAIKTGSSKSRSGKSQDTESNIGWVGSLSGDSSAPGEAMAANGTGGSLTISAARTLLDGTINLDGSKTGGTAHITGSDFLSFGSILSASGADAGGKIQLDAGGFSLAGRITVNAALGKGGSVDIKASRRAIDTGDAFIDASGLHGGSIRYVSDDQIISSGKFRASGSHGFGGTIDVSAPRLDLFSAQFYAQGGIRGGRVRLGGEFQGGKALTTDELPNALKLVATDAVTIDVSAIGMRGNAGEIVIWSDEKTTFLGNAIARGGMVGGVGGQIEISGKETLVYRGTVETARDGQRGGTLLLDPKNIIIADGASAPSQYSLVLQAFASNFPAPVPSQPGLGADDALGAAVSLNGNRLAVGARTDDGAANNLADAGAVYLFTFADATFAAPTLQAVLGAGYSGGKNLSITQIEAGDQFGWSVSLDGNRLAVGARLDNGAANAVNDAGAVYLFTFADAVFTSPALQAIIGQGYSGGNNLSVSELEADDRFGASVSLNGNRLAVGADGDNGASNGLDNPGAVYLFTFVDANFSGGQQEAILGQGYTGGKNLSIANLGAFDQFGLAVSLSGNRLAVGAYEDDGQGDTVSASGAVYLFSFDDAAFTGGALESTIGADYSGGKNFAVANLSADDRFGWSLSLEGTRLAVGAIGDDGFGDGVNNAGAVYLFSFTDDIFSSPTLVGVIGKDYAGSADVPLASLEADDQFGWSVSLSGNRLAVGAPADDGGQNSLANSGAVYLFSFADSQFSGGRQVGTIGAGYSGFGGLSLIGNGLDEQDAFGASVSLSGNRLAVGAPVDDGRDNLVQNAGAVYLFSFGDAQFSAPVLQAIIGSGYGGGKNISVDRLQVGDQFGTSVSLDAASGGLSLAVGAIGDDGQNNDAPDAGAVYLFTFADSSFGGGQLRRVLGFETLAAAGGSISGAGSTLGSAVSLQANIIAVGAAGDAGFAGSDPQSGAVHIFDLGDTNFSVLPTRLVTIGLGYTLGQDISIADLGGGSSTPDRFGSAVSLDGLRLAVGSPGDDGFNDDFLDTGAVFLFTFGASDFSQGQLAATIGAFYTGPNDLTPTGIGTGATDQDFFGSAVGLKGLQLAVGARGDDGLTDTQNNAGAVYLFSLSSQSFSGIAQVGVIGADYLGAGSFALGLAKGEGFGSALAFDGNRLVVGAPGNDGRGVVAADAGAAYLFTFGAANFAEIRLAETLGYGFAGLNNHSVKGLNAFVGFPGQQLGSSVSLDGLRLAIGVPTDSGSGGSGFDLGAVYLFSFADLAFASPVLEATLGNGYSGGKNIPLSLSFMSKFGTAVALDGNRLAVGAPGDAGDGDPPGGIIGSVFLFTFSDSLFSGGALVGKVGLGQSGAQSIDVVGLDNFDAFGSSVALRGTSLVVGARGDDGVSDSITDSGAVYLFTFTDTDFSGGSQQGLISFGATAGAKDIDVGALQAGDQFGTSVALSRDGTTLFVGADGDDGSGDSLDNSGAVYQFAFGSSTFESGSLIGTFGFGYTGSADVNVSRLSPNDRFGTAVAFDANRLVVGAPGDGGIDGSLIGAGAAYIFTRPSTQFALSGLIGAGYGGDTDLPIGQLDEFDFLGTAVSLDGERLAVGAPGDGGLADTDPNFGAVYLFNLGTNFFGPPRLVGTIGLDYGPQQNLSVGQANGSALGSAVALSGTRLAIGAPSDRGFGDIGANLGAVYLITFADASFSSPLLRGTIGQGYTGAGNFDVGVLDIGDFFGSALALDGLRLAVGAPFDDGANNDRADSGAVYLFSFANNAFGSPVLEARMGANYTGSKNVDVAGLEADDQFGSSVSLLGNQLVVGARSDDGSGNLAVDSGAVYLYSFTSSIFNGGALEGIGGVGYTGGKNFSVTGLAAGDYFGSAVALTDSGQGLAIGASLDDGDADSNPNSGAVYLFDFTDNTYSGALQLGTIGFGYAGSTDFGVPTLGVNAQFGAALALSGTQLAIGAPGDFGVSGGGTDVGAVYLFGFTTPDLDGIGQIGRITAGSVDANNLFIDGLERDSNRLGSSVAIDGRRMVIGAAGNTGNIDTPFAGAAYLFTFSDDVFSDLAQAGTIGAGYANGPTSSLTAYGAGAGEQFGAAVSLEGLRLAVGAPLDRGGLGEVFQFGAVYLFSFADLTFSTPVLQSIIGAGYSGGKNLSVANLDVGDRFGVSVHLGSDGVLTVGADGDDGFANIGNDRGAVYRFTFADSLFSGASLQGIIGSGYSGSGDFNITLDDMDFFGTAVAADGPLLAVGAPGDDGSGIPGPLESVGAVHLFQLSGATVSQLGTIGSGYTGPGDFDLVPIDFQDGFGASLSLKGRQLVVGAPFDSGKDDSGGSSSFIGAAYAFTFSPGTPFADLAHVATIGFGYDGPNDINLASLGNSDFFGGAVSVDGTRLAINARQDSGALNDRTAVGAVYLFSFADTGFTGGTLEAIIGAGYTGGKNLSVVLDDIDIFGYSLSLDGNRLAVGALLDDGAGNGLTDSGSVYLFSFADAAFNGISLERQMGAAYRSTVALDIGAPPTASFAQVQAGDNFGAALSLDGLRLAIGAPGDDGSIDALADAGAVYLFTFTDAQFGGAALQSVIGHGYVGGKNLFVTQIGGGDFFGTSVSLDGNRLAVGAPRDDGAADSVVDAGAVYLFSFADAQFGGGTLEAIAGLGYTGGKNLNVTDLQSADDFGTSVSLSGNGLAVGAVGDDAAGNPPALNRETGAVYLFSFADAQFQAGALEAIFGLGFDGGGKDLDIALEDGDMFGASVALDGTRLAVGAIGDDGNGGGLANAGAVYLFTFADLAFSGGTQTGIVGASYDGPGDVDNVFTPFGMASSSAFGSSVSLDGNRLAIGGREISSTLASPPASGAVYLLTFADSSFGGGTIVEILGKGATNFGANLDFDVELEAADLFGSAVSLDGNRLVVGAVGDDGFGNGLSDSGAVYMFTFADAAFGGAQLRGNIGAGYTRGSGSPIMGIEAGDGFGTAVSLNGNRLAVGAPGDDGSGNSLTGSGAVYLITFADTDFAAPALSGVIGSGYTGGSNLSVSQLRGGARFGSAVSLDGSRLAVGTPGDSGALGSRGDAGAVYLFTFADATSFTTPQLAGIIGQGYAGANDFAVALNAGDVLGSAVSLRGTQLAVGAAGDDGDANAVFNVGAVYLFTFADLALNDAALIGRIGSGYSDSGDLNVTALESNDAFGSSLSLDGLRLVVGAPGDDGDSNGTLNAGAAHLFTLGDTQFATPALVRTLGALYLGADTVPGLGSGDRLGSAVALAGNVLAIGAPGDRGDIDALTDAGAVYIYALADSAFASDLQLISRIGSGYLDPADIDLSSVLVNGDLFGSALTLDTGRLVIGAPGDDGPDNVLADSGALYFFNLSGAGAALPGLTFGDDPGADVTISASALAAILSGGTGVTLQANNDITVNSAILVNNPSGDGGLLEFNAGRSIFINAGIATDNGIFRAYANDPGAVIANRDPGFADISFGTDGFVDAGTGAVEIRTFASVNPINYPRGTITLGNITGGTITVTNGTSGTSADGQVILSSSAILTASDAADAITIAGSVFTNNAGAGAFNLTGGGRFRVFSVDYDNIARGGLAGNNLYNRTIADSITQSGNLFIFSRQPILTFTADDVTRTYGQTTSSFTFQVSGLVNGDTESYAFSGLPDLFESGSGGAGLGSILIEQGTLSSDVGYGFDFVNGSLNVLRALLTVTANDASREYGLDNPIFTASFSGFVNGDDESVVSGLDFSTAANITSDAGTYTITPFNAFADNYDFNYVPGTLTITKALLTVTADDATREYGLANPSFTGSITGFRNGDTASVVSGLTYGSVATVASNVGTYAITGSGAIATNYDFSYVPGTLTITKALLTVTADNATREYGLANPTFTGTISGLRAGDTESVVSGLTYGTVATIASNVGTYAITASGGTATNYDFSYVPGTLTITKALLTVTADNASREYGLANPTFTGTTTGFRNGDTASVISGLAYSTVATVASDVGTYAIIGSGATATNYDFSYVPGTLTITKALLTVTADNASREYGLANPTFTGTITGFRNGDTATVISGLAYGTVATIASDVGTYAITGSGASATNYDFSYVPGTLTITKALLTVTADNVSREYGLANPTFTGTITGFRNGDTASAISGLTYGSIATVASDVGTYAITGSGATATNYDFSYVPGTLTITKALLTVTADNASREYGLANPTFTGSITGFRNGDTAGVISGLTYGSVATIASDVGTYAITGSGATATNYDFSYVPGTLTITKALLTVTADDASREYGLANPTFTGTITGFRNGDTASVISGLAYGTVATVASNVGTYAITGSGATATNYDFSYVPGTLTITRALLTVTADDATREYGLANPSFTGVISGLRAGDTATVVSGLTYGTAATITSNAGTYAITASGGTATNYDFAYVPGTLTITKALLTVTADDATREYGLANPSFTGSITGFRNGDTASVVSGLTYGSVATVASNVGTYAITGSGATATNYDFSYVPGTLTITRALLTVTADNASREYGLANPAFTGTVTGFRNGDTAAVISGLTYGSVATVASNVGTYAITGSGATATNYDFSYVPGTLTITKALLTVTADNASREYGLANPTFTGTITGYRNGDTASVVSGLTYGSVATVASDVGTYAITGSGATATNYDFSYVPGTLTITKALLTVTANDATREYGLANPTFTGSISGFRNGDTASVVSGLNYGSSAVLNSGIGTYGIVGSGAAATNYDFSYVPGTLTITRALLTVTADNAAREYGLANPTLTGSITGLRAGDTASVISGLVFGTTATSSSPVGSYAITGGGGIAANYDFAYVPGTLTISKALLTVTAANATREYGLANPVFTGSITGFRNGDNASVVSGLAYGSVATIASSAGSYAITGSGASATNYDFAYVPGTLTITKALLTVTANNASREYGLANPVFTGSITGFRNGDNAGVVSGLAYGSVATIASNAGSYAITGSGAAATNYDFAYVPGTLTITKALLTVTANNASREYGLANPTFTGSIVGLRNGDTASVISGLVYGSVATAGSPVGAYAITGSGASATNYDFSYTPGTLTVTKALLTVTAANATREYGLANPAFTGTITGLRNGDTASVISGLVFGTTATVASNVGSYAINGSGANATNYDFAYVPGTLTVTKALLTIRADDKAREYGLANPALTSTISGLRNGDTASVISGLVLATPATQASGIGNYAITASGASALNYDFSYVPGSMTINPATLTVAIDNKTRQYGSANPVLTASISGFRNGDTEQGVTGLRLATNANARSNVGNYVITGSSASAANYRFDYVPGTLSITKALLQVRVNDARREYGLANPTFTASISGFRNGDTASVVTGLAFGTPATIGSDVGLYAITASGASALNYDFSYIPGRLTISQAQLTITADSKTMTQGSSPPIMTVSYSGLRNGDTGDVVTGLVLRTSGGAGAAPGQYIINASRGTARNYQITYRPGMMTVLPAVTPPAQDPPGTGGSPTSPPGTTVPPVTVTLPPVTLPIAGGNVTPPSDGTAAPAPAAVPAADQGSGGPTPPVAPGAATPVVTMPSQGTVALPVPPESLSPMQVLQGLSAPLPVLVSPELRPAEEGEQSGTPQGDGQHGGCEYISLCNGTAAPLWTWQPAQ